MNEHQKLKKDFEKEVWLLISGELKKERMKFWEKKIKTTPDLSEILHEAKMLESELKNVLEPEFINNRNLDLLKEKFLNELNENNKVGKIKFKFSHAVSLIALTIVVFIFTLLVIVPVSKHRTINDNIAWNAVNIDDGITNIRRRLKILSFNNSNELNEIFYGPDSFEGELFLIKSNLLRIKNELLKNKF